MNKVNSHPILFIWLLYKHHVYEFTVGLLTNTINKIVLENYCYTVYMSQTKLLCALVQNFNTFIYQTLSTAIYQV